MTRDHERLLAEGPRVAPEPRTIEEFDAGNGRFVVREPGAARPSRSGGGLSLVRLLVPLLFVGFFVAQVAGAGGLAWILLLAAIVLGSLLAERGGKQQEKKEV